MPNEVPRRVGQAGSVCRSLVATAADRNSLLQIGAATGRQASLKAPSDAPGGVHLLAIELWNVRINLLTFSTLTSIAGTADMGVGSAPNHSLRVYKGMCYNALKACA